MCLSLGMISECQFLWFDALQKLLVAPMMFEQFHGASFLLQKIVAMDGLVSTIWINNITFSPQKFQASVRGCRKL